MIADRKRTCRINPIAVGQENLFALAPVAIYCDVNGETERFWTFFPVLPRLGESFALESGEEYLVEDIWNTTRSAGLDRTAASTTCAYVSRVELISRDL